MIFSMSYKIMKTQWYKLNIGNKKIIYRKTVDGLFWYLLGKEEIFIAVKEFKGNTERGFGSSGTGKKWFREWRNDWDYQFYSWKIIADRRKILLFSGSELLSEQPGGRCLWTERIIEEQKEQSKDS